MKSNFKKVYPTEWFRAEEVLNNNGVVVLLTDTLYGIVGKAVSKKAVDKIRGIKGRSNDKPFIVLISSLRDLTSFGIKPIPTKIANIIFKPKTSVELSYKTKKFAHIRAGGNYNAFRMVSPKNKNLFNLIKKVGPIVAPSANPQGFEPAHNIKEAKIYFGNKVDLYVSSGNRNSKPSKIIKYEDGNVIVLRK